MFISCHSITGPHLGSQGGGGEQPCYIFYTALSIVVGAAPAFLQWSDQEVGVIKGVTD